MTMICIQFLIALIIIKMRGKQSQLYRLAKNSIDLMKNYTNSQSLESQCQKYSILTGLNSLKFAQLGLNQISRTKGIGIRNILIYNSLRLTIYYLPKNETMKLHDHPKMQVVNYILRGRMEAKIYTNISKNIYSKETHVLEEKSMKFIDGIVSSKDNLHEFTALEPTFFLDIIFPDYDQTQTCTHYKQDPNHGSPNVELIKIENDDIDFFQI